MGDWGAIEWLDAVAREATLFAAIGFLVGGLDDLAVDAVHFLRIARARWRGWREPTLADFPREGCRRRIAVFVPAWDESAVIGAMLRTALARFDHRDYRIYVGTYPNDRATIDSVAAVATADDRVRLVVLGHPGPTTKADCLNALWHALLRDVAIERRECDGIVLHDAEDVVHAGELRVFDHLLATADAVQLPVVPLADPASRFVAGHYLEEFAEAHAKQMPVRQALGAGLPFAGTGCAIAMPMLAAVAATRGGDPFDAASLTEDYELGLTIAALGGRGRFVRAVEYPGGPPVAVHAFFPATLPAAIRQKARWMTGIALAGWDRVGWSRAGGIGDHWMRMRDRRTILAMPVLAVAYATLVLWTANLIVHRLAETPVTPPEPALRWILALNACLLAWRLAMRAAFVGALHGRAEALLSIPRTIVANFIALMAARRALSCYLAMLRGGDVRWDKTAHHFPDLAEAQRP